MICFGMIATVVRQSQAGRDTSTDRRGIAQEQRALDQLQAQTWGVWLHEDTDATRYVVLPRGTFGETWPVTVLGQTAIRLSSE